MNTVGERIAIVREAKARRKMEGYPEDLPPSVLDEILPDPRRAPRKSRGRGRLEASRVDPATGHYLCMKCRVYKPADQFYPRKGVREVVPWCRPCEQAYAADRRAKRREAKKQLMECCA